MCFSIAGGELYEPKQQLPTVIPGSKHSGEKACMQEMMDLMACMTKFGGDQVPLL
jgi:hypothetical protein